MSKRVPKSVTELREESIKTPTITLWPDWMVEVRLFDSSLWEGSGPCSTREEIADRVIKATEYIRRDDTQDVETIIEYYFGVRSIQGNASRIAVASAYTMVQLAPAKYYDSVWA